MDTALYFPHIQVPETPWFTHVLLYWDEAAAIVPGNGRDDFMTPYMSELRSAGLLNIVRAHEAESALHPIADVFMRVVEAQPRVTGREGIEWSEIHVEKMGNQLFSQLSHEGFARRAGRPDGAWFQVEKGIAALYMGMLAAATCRSRSGFFPVTDASHRFSEMAREGVAADGLNALHHASIQQILPIPSRQIPVRQLIEFKEQHGNDLRRLRLHLDNRVLAAASINDPQEKERALELVAAEVANDVRIISDNMSRPQWGRVLLSGVGGLVASGLSLASAMTSGGAGLGLGLAIGAGAVGLGVAAHDGWQAVRRPIDPQTPLAYAALVDRL